MTTENLIDAPAQSGAALSSPASVAPRQKMGGNLTYASDNHLLANSKIMIVDAEPLNVDSLKSFLGTAGCVNVVSTGQHNDVYDMLATESPDVLLLDLMAPPQDGLKVLAHLHAEKLPRQIPVIVLTSVTDNATKLRALELGASDFLTKPVDADELALRLRNTLATRPVSGHDPLTGLPNRTSHLDALDRILRFTRRYNMSGGAQLHVGLGRFRQINDTLGPAIGDRLLREVAQRLQHFIRDTDSAASTGTGSDKATLAHLGGDDFNVLLPVIARPSDAGAVAQRMADMITAPYLIEEHELYITCHIGIAVFPGDGTTKDSILKYASIALRHSKQAGQSGYQFYSKELNTSSVNRLKMESDLRKGIERGELRLFYQPKIDLKTNCLYAAEALVRWQHPEHGLVSPAEFIPIAEETGLIVNLGEWVLRESCRQVHAWQTAGLMAPRIAINVSSLQFRRGDLVKMVSEIMLSTGIEAAHISLELTESVLMDSAHESVTMLSALKEAGISLSIDDFGTGYSSLSYLKRFPLDELKIDRSFITGVNADNDNSTIVTAIIGMAHNLGLKVVAEGVETREELAFLLAHNCDACQGFLFSRPLPAIEFGALLQTSTLPPCQPQ